MYKAKRNELSDLTLFDAVKASDALASLLADKTSRGTILRFRVDMGPVDEDTDKGNNPEYRKAN